MWDAAINSTDGFLTLVCYYYLCIIPSHNLAITCSSETNTQQTQTYTFPCTDTYHLSYPTTDDIATMLLFIADGTYEQVRLGSAGQGSDEGLNQSIKSIYGLCWLLSRCVPRGGGKAIEKKEKKSLATEYTYILYQGTVFLEI